jgi:hypothetical protein
MNKSSIFYIIYNDFRRQASKRAHTFHYHNYGFHLDFRRGKQAASSVGKRIMHMQLVVVETLDSRELKKQIIIMTCNGILITSFHFHTHTHMKHTLQCSNINSSTAQQPSGVIDEASFLFIELSLTD